MTAHYEWFDPPPPTNASSFTFVVMCRGRKYRHRLVIYDFAVALAHRRRGRATAYLSGLRQRYKWVVIEGATHTAVAFWRKMFQRGLVDEIHPIHRTTKTWVRGKDPYLAVRNARGTARARSGPRERPSQ